MGSRRLGGSVMADLLLPSAAKMAAVHIMPARSLVGRSPRDRRLGGRASPRAAKPGRALSPRAPQSPAICRIFSVPTLNLRGIPPQRYAPHGTVPMLCDRTAPQPSSLRRVSNAFWAPPFVSARLCDYAADEMTMGCRTERAKGSPKMRPSPPPLVIMFASRLRLSTKRRSLVVARAAKVRTARASRAAGKSTND